MQKVNIKLNKTRRYALLFVRTSNFWNEADGPELKRTDNHTVCQRSTTVHTEPCNNSCSSFSFKYDSLKAVGHWAEKIQPVVHSVDKLPSVSKCNRTWTTTKQTLKYRTAITLKLL